MPWRGLVTTKPRPPRPLYALLKLPDERPKPLRPRTPCPFRPPRFPDLVLNPGVITVVPPRRPEPANVVLPRLVPLFRPEFRVPPNVRTERVPVRGRCIWTGEFENVDRLVPRLVCRAVCVGEACVRGLIDCGLTVRGCVLRDGRVVLDGLIRCVERVVPNDPRGTVVRRFTPRRVLDGEAD